MTTTMNLEEQYRVAVEAVTTPAFRATSAREKQEKLWSYIAQFPYEPIPSAHSSMLKLAARLLNLAFLKKAFVLDADVRPPRTKPFHTHGTVAKMQFIADGRHPFTGIFATGGVGFIRASLAVGMPEYSPAIALKFLAEGDHPARNMLLHQSLDRQASRDFFERAPTNHTLTPSSFPNTLMFPLLKLWLGKVSTPIELQLLDHLAAVKNDGSVVAQPVAPELVHLYAGDDAHNDPASTDDFRSLLADIPAGTLLYRMYGKATRKEKQVYIGSVTLESNFVASEFGDCILAFRHAWGSKDSGVKA